MVLLTRLCPHQVHEPGLENVNNVEPEEYAYNVTGFCSAYISHEMALANKEANTQTRPSSQSAFGMNNTYQL